MERKGEEAKKKGTSKALKCTCAQYLQRRKERGRGKDKNKKTQRKGEEGMRTHLERSNCVACGEQDSSAREDRRGTNEPTRAASTQGKENQMR
jgi:hypothetical protein